MRTMTTTKKPRNALGYTRISDARGDVRSIDDQDTDIRDRAAQLGWNVTRILREPDTSAWKKRKVGPHEWRVIRPKFHEALTLLRDGVHDGMIAYDLDRAARDPRDLEDLIDLVERDRPGLPVESATGSLRLANDADVTMSRVQVAIANKASRDTSRRVKRACKTRAENGGVHGGRRPFGYSTDGMTIVESEATEVRRITRDLLAGTSLRAVTKDLNTRGVDTVTGRPWTPTAVRDMLLRPRNAGLSTHGKDPDGRPMIVGTAQWTPLLDEDDWHRLVALLENPDRKTSPGGQPKWLGSGLYRCGICDDGTTMRVSHSSTNKGPAYRCWSGTAHLTRSARLLDEYVTGALLLRLEDPALQEARRRRNTPDSANGAARELTELRRYARDLEARLDKPMPASVLDTLIGKLTGVQEKIAEAQARLDAASPTDVLAGLPGENVDEAWLNLDLDRRRAILEALVVVTVLPSPKKGVRTLDPACVQLAWK